MKPIILTAVAVIVAFVTWLLCVSITAADLLMTLICVGALAALMLGFATTLNCDTGDHESAPDDETLN